MSVNARVRRLEAGSQRGARQTCRRCSGIWIYPDQFPPVDGVQPPKPTCEAPGQCPGGGLLIDLSGDERASCA
jgi:hypothetical protein